MKLLMSEYTAGFSNYSNILCNYFARAAEFEQIIYLTPQNNSYFDIVDDSVDKRKVYDVYINNDAHRKGSVRWAADRIIVSLKNCMIRNQIIRKEKPDVVLLQASHSRFDWFFLRLINNKTNKILTVHDVIVPTKSFSWNKKSLKRMYNDADRLVVHSETNKKQMVNLFGTDPRKITVIPHGLIRGHKNIEKKECKKELGIKTDKKVLLFYGDMRKTKGLDIFLKSVKGLDCHILISGTPPYGETFEPYQKIIDEENLSATLILKYTSDEFRDVLFQASDYLVLPYREFYSQSGVFMQAIQYHLPIIATNVSSFEEYINKYDIGYIAKKNDIEDLRRAILLAITTKKDFEDGMKRAEEENCWEVSGNKYIETILHECSRKIF